MRILHGVEGTLGIVPDRCVTNGGNGRRDVFHVSYDPAAEDVTEVVARSVAVIHNVEPDELSPLAGVVDTDALSTVLERSTDGGSDVQVSFVYEDLEITIDGAGNVWLEWV